MNHSIVPLEDGLAQLRHALGLKAFAPQELFAPRADLGDGVYSAPQWAADREMCHHHEMSYCSTYPDMLLLTTLNPPTSGGFLLLADTRQVLSALPASLVERFRPGWLLTRTYRPYLGLPWSVALGVSSVPEASALLDARQVHYEWGPDGTLTTRQVRPAIVTHPVTGEECWFNDVAFFSQWAVDPAERSVMLNAFGPLGLPFNTFLADGSPLPEPDFDAVLAAYDAAGSRVVLQPGEALILDNVLTAHGREPYTGQWDLAVAPCISPRPAP